MSPDEQREDEDQRGAGERDKEEVVILEGAEGRASVGEEDEGEKFRDDDARRVRIDVVDRPPFRELIERVERQGEEEEEAHRSSLNAGGRPAPPRARQTRICLIS